MIIFNQVTRSSRFLLALLSIITLISITALGWIGFEEKASINEMRHVVNSDLGQIGPELLTAPALSGEIQSHLKNTIATSHIVYAVILLSSFLLALFWIITFFHLKKLKNIKANEKQLEELLYYSQVNEIHETPSMHQLLPPAIRKIQLDREAFLDELKHALEHDEFILHYQPIVNVQTGKITSVESLIRWQHPIHGLLSPDTFLPLCENNGFIVPLTEWVIRTACHQIKEWQNLGIYHGSISINLSAKQLNDPGLLSLITRFLSLHQLSPDILILEITENSIMKDMQNSIRIIQSIRELGVKFSLDDFGTGYSSLQYLKHLPVSNIKIDRMFIRDMSTSITSFGIVESVITLGKSIGLMITAEGVENRSQLHVLKKMGCDQVQGYLYGKPLPAAEFNRCLDSEKEKWTNNPDGYHAENPGYKFEVMTDKYHDEAVDVITESFCEYGPMTKYLNIKPHEFKPVARIMVEKAIRDGLSMVALDQKKVIACTIVDDIADSMMIVRDVDMRFKIIFSLLDSLSSDFFSERAMYKGHIARLLITAVNKDYLGQGLSRKINFESIQLAKDRSFDFMCCAFKHDYNEKTVKHLKNSKLLIRSCRYQDFVHEGEKPFRNLEGSVNAYIWELRKGAKLRYKINYLDQ